MPNVGAESTLTTKEEKTAEANKTKYLVQLEPSEDSAVICRVLGCNPEEIIEIERCKAQYRRKRLELKTLYSK